MGAERWDEQVGSVADEAARLLESLRRAAADAAPDGSGASDASDESDESDPTGATREPSADDPGPQGGPGDGPGCSDPFCQWCPLCRTSAVVRSLSPQTLSRLADLAGVAAALLADLANARTGTEPADAPTAPEDARAGRARPIPVRDADDPQEDPRG